MSKKLQNYLVLNKYLCSFFGFKEMEDFRKQLKNVAEGVNQNKKFYFTEALQTLNISEEFRQKLNQYDENIQEYLTKINQKRDPPIVLKYFQYVAILFTEIYLDKYFNEFDSFYADLTKFVLDLNTKEKKTGIYTYPYPNKTMMRKLAFWSATGSGKTLIMHINFLQFLKYNTMDYDNILLITPNEGLSQQHLQELKESNLDSKRFEAQKTLEDWSMNHPVKVIEITKIKDEVNSQDGVTIPVEAFGSKNIVLVDEGQKGYSTEAKTWQNIRRQLVSQGGFTFEYSATFGEVTDKDETFNDYASSIIFDYRYKYFYEDGFGKDYNILNLKNKEEYGDEYFTGAMLSLYEQKLYFQEHKREIKHFNIENPLMIFVGSSVSGKKNNSDVLQVVKFLARFVNEKENFSTLIKNILQDNSSLVNNNDEPIFANKFSYLREIVRKDSSKLDQMYDDMLKLLFHVKTSKTLQFFELQNAQGEIGLKFDNDYFGVINIGDTNNFLKLVEEEDVDYFQIGQKSNFEPSLFHKIEKNNSPINFLIGSKKFIEGWNSHRVSAMGLLNIGKKEGSQIIQLFGRGVRLRGYGNYLKRSYALEHEGLIPSEVNIPSKMTLLETLNIFGLNANYMAVFKETLREEGIEEYEKIILEIQPNLPSTSLYVPRSNQSNESFANSIQITNLNQNIASVKIDLSSKIDVLESKKELKQVDSQSPVKENKLDDDILEILDFDEIYLELLKYKDLKKYTNVYFTKVDLKNVIASKNYSILCKKAILRLNENDELYKLEKIKEYVIQLLKSHVNKLFNHEKYQWYQKNLQYETLSEEDGSLIPKEYVFTINTNAQSLIQNIKDFTNQLRSFIRVNSQDGSALYENNTQFKYNSNNILDFFAYNIQLFKPFIYKNSKEKELDFLKISPTNLVESERDFIRQLNDYLDFKKDELEYDEIYLLRNPSKKGIGFFQTQNFYPDFILWIIKGSQQSITFIEPHGLQMTTPNDEKLSLPNEIKKIQRDMNDKYNSNLILNAFILSPTNYNDLSFGIEKAKLEDANILFMEDGQAVIGQIVDQVLGEMD